jgi:hypothetical protein
MPFFTMRDGTTAHVSLGGPERVIHVDGRDWRFEDHEFHGPSPLNKRGDPIDPERVPQRVWVALTQWYQGGKRLDGDGKALWDEPVDETAAGLADGSLVKVGRNIYPKETYERIAAKLAAKVEP